MRIVKFFSLMLCSLTLTACAAFEPTRVTLQNNLSAEEGLALYNAVGKNSIRGSALLRNANGKVATCAGLEVTLTPATPYATERLQYAFPSLDHGYSNYYDDDFIFVPDAPGYYASQRTAICDADGSFWFEDLQDGTYYITSYIQWIEKAKNPKDFDTNYSGTVLQRITLQGAKRHRIVVGAESPW